MGGTGGDRNYRRQRALLYTGAEQREGTTSEDSVWRAFGCLRLRHAGRAQGGVSGAAWSRASHSSERAEFSREYSRVQAAGSGEDCLRFRRGVAEGKTQVA